MPRAFSYLYLRSDLASARQKSLLMPISEDYSDVKFDPPAHRCYYVAICQHSTDHLERPFQGHIVYRSSVKRVLRSAIQCEENSTWKEKRVRN